MYSRRDKQESGGSENSLSSSSLPRTVRKKQNVFVLNLPLQSPSAILSDPPGKGKRTNLHRVVHAFRAAHGFEPEEGKGFSKHYWKQIRRFEIIPDNCSEKQAIKTLSTPRCYKRIRGADRMRISAKILSREELQILCREIRAALVWSVTENNSNRLRH